MKKMLNITNHRNANQDHEIITLSPLEYTYKLKNRLVNVDEDMEKTGLYICGGNIKWCSWQGKYCGGSSKNLK
jgi:hypothetical protein